MDYGWRVILGPVRAPTAIQSNALLASTGAILVLVGVASAVGGLASGRTDVDVLGRRLGALTVGEVTAVICAAVGIIVFTRTSPGNRWIRAAFIAAV